MRVTAGGRQGRSCNPYQLEQQLRPTDSCPPLSVVEDLLDAGSDLVRELLRRPPGHTPGFPPAGAVRCTAGGRSACGLNKLPRGGLPRGGLDTAGLDTAGGRDSRLAGTASSIACTRRPDRLTDDDSTRWGRGMADPRGIACSLPPIPMGTTGTPARTAR